MDRFTEMALFVEVADRGSLGAAAEALGLSNPAATRYLASLEERLQVRLVERNTRRLYLTPTTTAPKRAIWAPSAPAAVTRAAC